MSLLTPCSPKRNASFWMPPIWCAMTFEGLLMFLQQFRATFWANKDEDETCIIYLKGIRKLLSSPQSQGVKSLVGDLLFFLLI
ncbi:hypothetical protein Lal_00014073 [Lupinus albus]|nr:hypothetical protein Lal_00014073 [Lupinus albus]